MKKLRLTKLLGVKPKDTFFLKPVSLPEIKLICPVCAAEVVWQAPTDFQIAIVGHLLVTCSNQHRWVVAGAFERADNNDWMRGVYGIPEAKKD